MTKPRKKILKLGDKKFNPKNRFHRIRLYKKVFLSERTESILNTLLQESLNLASKTQHAAIYGGTDQLIELSNALADIEIAIEIVKQKIPALETHVYSTKLRKLDSLFNTIESKEDQSEPENISKEIVSDLKEEVQSIKSNGQSKDSLKRGEEIAKKKEGFIDSIRKSLKSKNSVINCQHYKNKECHSPKAKNVKSLCDNKWLNCCYISERKTN
jgi:hypothetical protein